MTDPSTDYVTVDDLRRMTNDDLEKYRTSSWVNAIWSLPRADLEKLAEGHPDPRTDPKAWKKGLAGWLARGILGDPGADLDQLARSQIRQRPSERETIQTGRDLAARFLHPGLQRTLKTMVDELEERSDGTREGIARVTTAQYLKALQLFTYAARVPAGTVTTKDDFASAASYLVARGDRFGAAILLGFASQVTEGHQGAPGNVLATHERWAARHFEWQRLAAARRPACRSVHEDQVLARMLNDPGDTRLGLLVTGDMFTSHLRAELHDALTLCGPGQARTAFAHALARAPGWALRDIGWPDAPRALRYFDRLAATPVTAAQAHQAALAVGEAAERNGNRCLEAVTAESAGRRRVPPPPSRRTVAPLLAPPPSAPAPAGPVPAP